MSRCPVRKYAFPIGKCIIFTALSQAFWVLERFVLCIFPFRGAQFFTKASPPYVSQRVDLLQIKRENANKDLHSLALFNNKSGKAVCHREPSVLVDP